MAIVRTASVGDLDHLVVAHRTRLVALAARVVGRSEAEDVVQEAFLKLVNDPVRDRPQVEALAWLRRVCLNLAFNRRRDVARWQARGALGAGPQPDLAEPADRHALREEERAKVRDMLARLPERQRNVLLLRHSGYSYAETAAALDIPMSSVGTTLARAESAFRARYEGSNDERMP